jgi:acyl-CoA synthetase (AMP-forming)/AMP-acid ligase II
MKPFKENVIRKMIQTVKIHPDKIAIIEKRRGIIGGPDYRKFTYSQMMTDIRVVASRLRKKGFKKGDRIVVFTPMSYELYVIVLAVFYIGAVTVFMDAWASRERLTQACLTVKPKGFIGCLKAQLLMIVPEIRKIPVKILDRQLFLPSIPGNLKDEGPAQISEDDEGLVTLTTGSTGMPKGANRTHGFLSEQFEVLIRHLGIGQSNIDLTALPVFVFCNLGAGATSVLPVFNPAKPTEFDPETVIKQIKECRINTSVGSPAFYEKLADYLTQKNEQVSIKRIYTGGAPVFKALAKKFSKAFPDTDIEIVYGCTEAEPISSIKLDEFLKSDSSLGVAVGYPDPAVEVKILKPLSGVVVIEEGKVLQDYLAAPGEVGEIIVTGPHVLKSYMGDIDAWRENKITDGERIWHRTGDAGMVDSSGRICLYGRVKNAIHTFKGDLYSLPYEQMMMDIEGVSFASIMEVDGRLFAAVEPNQDLPESQRQELVEIAKGMLGDLNPFRIFLMNRIPRDPRHNSKVDFTEFRKKCLEFQLR